MVCDMLPVTVSPGVFKTLNDRQPEFNKKCEAIKQIFMDHKSNSWKPLGLRWAQRVKKFRSMLPCVRNPPTCTSIINLKIKTF